jgi:TPR repeat protein
MAENIFEIQKKAENGDAYSQHEMGVNYQYGYGVPVDKLKSMEWFQKAADNGNSESMRALGIIYECGMGVDKDPGKAFDFFQKSVEAGNTKSLQKLAWYFEEGVVVEKNEGKAKELYERFFTELQKQALDGDADAMYRMGDIYQYGLPQLGIPVYYQQAAEWYEKAANRGNMYAQTSLGILYYLGLGVPKNYTKAAEWYKKAAEQGDASAMYNLAGCYRLGRGVEQNDELAAKYNQKAANMDMPEAQAELAGMYYRGTGVEQDYTMAVHWFKKAIANGYENAYYGLGCCYYDGHGVEKNRKEAFHLYELGEKRGDRHCLMAVAECCIEGQGTPIDYVRAKRILEDICAEHEDNQEETRYATIEHENEQLSFWYNPLDEKVLSYYAKAYYLLGTLYYAGKGTGGANSTKAIAMLRMADRLGYEGNGMSPQKLIERIVDEAENEDVDDATDCYVEVRERKSKGERYDVVLHHADGTETIVKFVGRNKFIYLLALLIAHEGKSVAPLSTAHFSYMRDSLAEMAEILCVDTSSFCEWIDEFVYAETDDAKDLRDSPGHKGQCYCSPSSSRYSNAYSGANRAIKSACSTDDFELFRLRSTGGRYAVTGLALDASQIELPESLAEYLDELPTQKEISGHKVEGNKWLPIKRKEKE